MATTCPRRKTLQNPHFSSIYHWTSGFFFSRTCSFALVASLSGAKYPLDFNLRRKNIIPLYFKFSLLSASCLRVGNFTSRSSKSSTREINSKHLALYLAWIPGFINTLGARLLASVRTRCSWARHHTTAGRTNVVSHAQLIAPTQNEMEASLLHLRLWVLDSRRSPHHS